MANTFTARDTLKTKLLAALGSATSADQIVKLSRTIEKANLDDDTDLETALDTKVSAMASTASTEDIEKLAFGVKKLRTAATATDPVSSMIPEGSSNLYVTDSRVRSSFSASGDLSYDSGTGVLSYTALPDALTVYATVADLPLPENTNVGAKGIVEENKKLYINSGSDWLNVGLVDQKPSFTTTPDGSYTLSPGADTVITLNATDPQGDPITFSHVVSAGSLGGSTVSQSGNVFTITGSSDSNDTAPFSITFRASDGTNITDATSEFTVQFTVVPNWGALDGNYETLITGQTNNGELGAALKLAGDYLIAAQQTGTLYWGFDMSSQTGEVSSSNALWQSNLTGTMQHYSDSLAANEHFFVTSLASTAHGHSASGMAVVRPSDGHVYGYLYDAAVGTSLGYGVALYGDGPWYVFSAHQHNKHHFLFKINSLEPFNFELVSHGKNVGEAFLDSSVVNAGGLHGSEVSLGDNLVVMSAYNAPWNGVNGSRNNGSVHLYDYAGSLQSSLYSPLGEPDADRENGFGGGNNRSGGTHVDGNTLYVGEQGNIYGSNNTDGAIHIYDISDVTSPTLTQTIRPSDLGLSNAVHFGRSIQVSQTSMLISYKNSSVSGNGEAYAIVDTSDMSLKKNFSTVMGFAGWSRNSISVNSYGIGTFAYWVYDSRGKIAVHRTT